MDQAERDLAFLFELELVLNASAERMVELGGLRYGILFWERRAISAEMLDVGPDGGHGAASERWARWRAAISALRMDLRVDDEARALLEARYLDGRVALFPDTLERWTRLRGAVDDLASLDGPDALGVPGPIPTLTGSGWRPSASSAGRGHGPWTSSATSRAPRPSSAAGCEMTKPRRRTLMTDHDDALVARPSVSATAVGTPSGSQGLLDGSTAGDWRCTRCRSGQGSPPDSLLLGGYGRGHCSTCSGRTVWESARLKDVLRAG